MRGGASVVAQAPAAKRALERFVHEMHSLFLRAGEPPEAITVGFLKHRDIEGNAMPSQVRHSDTMSLAGFRVRLLSCGCCKGCCCCGRLQC